MKIHIVQKGDTLWNLSKKYNVDFQALKAANTQLANPDLIMPGMKIKIPIDKKHVSHQGVGNVSKEKVMTPYKQMPQKAQPVIKEDDQKPKQKIQKKIPYPTVPPVSIQMPKLPNIQANQYNIDVDIEDHDTLVKQTQTTQPQHYPVQQVQEPNQQPIPEQPVINQPDEPKTAPWPQANMMWMPCLPCSMMVYPQQPYYPQTANICNTYQNPSTLQSTKCNQMNQWQTQVAQPYPYNPNPQWGELNVNAQPEENTSQPTQNQLNDQPYYWPYQSQWPMQASGYQPYSSYYPTYGSPAYQPYATYAPRTEKREKKTDKD